MASLPVDVEKVELGRYLFYDTRLSGNQTMSCASCHEQSLGFTDGTAVATGSTGNVTVNWSGLTSNTIYLGGISHNTPQGLSGLTVITIGN